MLPELDIEDWSKVGQLFESHILVNSIIRPCIKAGIGSVSVDNTDIPTVAMYSTPLMIFLAGDADSRSAQEIATSLPPHIMLFVPNDEWGNLLKSEWGNLLVTSIRTHLDHSTLSLEHLRNLKGQIGSDYTLKELDIDAAEQFTEDYAIQVRLYFGSLENLIKRGIGFCIMLGEKLVSCAFTPVPLVDEFEIQVYTENSPKYRRKGLATVVSAALIEYGLERNLIPHWDAANEPSVKLALKLGYSNPKTWEAFYHKPE